MNVCIKRLYLTVLQCLCSVSYSLEPQSVQHVETVGHISSLPAVKRKSLGPSFFTNVGRYVWKMPTRKTRKTQDGILFIGANQKLDVQFFQWMIRKKHCNFTVQVQLVQCTAGSKKFWRNPNFQLHQLQLSSKRFQNNFYKDIRRVNLEQRGWVVLVACSIKVSDYDQYCIQCLKLTIYEDISHWKKISVAVSFWYWWLFPFFFGVFMLLFVGICWIFLVCL